MFLQVSRGSTERDPISRVWERDTINRIRIIVHFLFIIFLLLYIQDVSRKALGVISRADTIVRQAQAAFENG